MFAYAMYIDAVGTPDNREKKRYNFLLFFFHILKDFVKYSATL